MSFVNTHLSFSRLSRFEQCPLSFKLHYINKLVAEPGVPLIFGKALHEVLETLIGEVLQAEEAQAIFEDHAADVWQKTWAASGLVGVALFEEGLHIVRDFVRAEGVVDPHNVLAIERPFELTIGRFLVVGAMDRVNRIDDETIEVLDYKSNRVLFTREEVNSSLQMGIYHLAARELWPWAKNIKLKYVMLRHGICLETTRTEEQLEAARRYIATTGEQTESAEEYPARLNANCSYCDHRNQCSVYAEALAGHRTIVAKDETDLAMVAREREHVANVAKIAYARKQELEKILKARLEETPEVVAGGQRYFMSNAASVQYPLAATLATLEKATGVSRDDLATTIAVVDKSALEALVGGLTKQMTKSQVLLLKLDLDSKAVKTFSQRFNAREAR